MPLTDTQRAALEAPLDRAHVKTREQATLRLSYIEAWHAIAEANRIFGFDGWTRRTLELKCVQEAARKVGKEGSDGWGVSYLCRVEVSALGVTREGCGAGHGIDRDLGLAHESAAKEAESDAMKRALATFGNQFGLALYDKAQVAVTGSQRPQAATPAARPMPSRPPAIPTMGADEPETGSLTITRVYSQLKPYAIILSDGRKMTFFSDSLLDQAKALEGMPVRIQTEEREKNGKVYVNLVGLESVENIVPRTTAPSRPGMTADGIQYDADPPHPADGPDDDLPF